MSLNRWAKRTDANQAEIIEGLRAAGYSVYIIGKPVDLLVWSRSTGYHILDVKAEKGSRTTKAQKEFIRTWPGPIHWVKSLQMALEAVSGT